MAERFRSLLANAVVIPQKPEWSPKTLGASSVIQLLSDGEGAAGTSSVSPSTGTKGEHYVRWVDGQGTVQSGWMAGNTPMAKKGSQLVWTPAEIPHEISSWDQLRRILAHQGFTIMQWCTSMKAVDRNLARQVIRELGGSVPKTKDNELLKTVLLRVTQAHTKEDQMAKAKKAAASAKAATPEKEEKGERSNSALESTASQLTELKVKHPAIAKMQGGKVSASALAELRDHINELALAARDGNKPQRASKLSAANRSVRKLQRRLAAA